MRRECRSRRVNEAEVFFAPKSASSAATILEHTLCASQTGPARLPPARRNHILGEDNKARRCSRLKHERSIPYSGRQVAEVFVASGQCGGHEYRGPGADRVAPGYRPVEERLARPGHDEGQCCAGIRIRGLRPLDAGGRPGRSVRGQAAPGRPGVRQHRRLDRSAHPWRIFLWLGPRH